MRHLDFVGLRVLDLGAGMVRFAAIASCAHLTVVEGTQARFDAASARLRDLENWSGHVANIQTFILSANSTSCVSSVFWSRLFLSPSESARSVFSSFICHAASFLKEDGVLLLAIENKLRTQKCWSGAAGDHSVKCLMGSARIAPASRALRGLFRAGCSLLREAGLFYHEEFYPFPDYKIPSCVMCDGLSTH